MTSTIYQIGETDITWLDTGGSELLTLTSLGAGAGRQGARHDFGVLTTARPQDFIWRFFMQFAAAPVVGEVIEIYWKSDDGTHADNDDGTGDIALSDADKLRNLTFLDALVVDENNATPEFSKGSADHVIQLPNRHGMPVIFNNTVTAFSGTAAEHGFILTPLPLQAQDT
jgi:hypothetical protein